MKLGMSLHMVELCPHGTDIHEILYRRFLPKSVKKIHVWLKSDKKIQELYMRAYINLLFLTEFSLV
jgi:hypothetical protein